MEARNNLVAEVVSDPEAFAALSIDQRREVLADLLTVTIAIIKMWINRDGCQVKDIYLRDEDGNPLEDDDDESEAYVHVTEARGEECITMTFSPKEIHELEEACRASHPSRPMRAKRKHARNLKRREPERVNRVKKNAAN
jgi:hypothetical protein